MQNEKLYKLGQTIINCLNDKQELLPLSQMASFVKGTEVGSQNYIENNGDGLIRYLRVGDLLQLGNTFVEDINEYAHAEHEDILIAFDGAPGRNSYGLEGAYSSGIYKVNCVSGYKGFIYFELNSELNIKIINDYSQGTTILHASKAIPHLKYSCVATKDIDKLNTIFSQMLINKKKISELQNVKFNLLSKYF